MDDALQTTIAQLSEHIQGWRAAAQIPAEMADLAQDILSQVQRREWPAAAESYARAAALAAAQADRASEAFSRYGQGIALYSQPDRQAESIPSFERAAELAEQLSHRSLAARAHFVLSALRLDNGNDPEACLAEQSRAAGWVDEAAEPALAVEIYRAYGFSLWLLGRLASARVEMERALAVAQRAGLAEMVLSIRASLRVLEASIAPASDGPELYEALIADARQSGRRDVLGDLKLHQAAAALRRDDPERALRHAETARQSALAASDLMRYLRYMLACQLIATARERLGDRVGVIDILLTCRATLGRELSPEAGEAMRTFLDGLPGRWGAAEFNAALQAYRRRAAARAGREAVENVAG